MSTTSFQATIVLNGGYSPDGLNIVWECPTTFIDNDFVYTGLDIAAGDIVAIDTATLEPGTFTFYSVSRVITADVSSPTLELTYLPINNNSWGPQPLDNIFGQMCTISRPSGHYGLLPVISTNVQGVSDKFAEYVQNYNFVNIVDNIMSRNNVVPTGATLQVTDAPSTATSVVNKAYVDAVANGDRVVLKINGDTSALTKGMPVYIDDADSTLCHAGRANSRATAMTAGLIMDAFINSGDTGAIILKGLLEQPAQDWDVLTGLTGGLHAGRNYFLRGDMAGGISSTPPTTDGMFIGKIGKAVSPTVLDVNVEPLIEL